MQQQYASDYDGKNKGVMDTYIDIDMDIDIDGHH